LVGAGAADEDVLIGFASEQLDVALDLAGNEVDPVDDDVPHSVSEKLFGFFEVVDVAVDDFDAFGGWSGGFSSVEEGEFEALLHGEGRAGGANDPGSANEEGFHGITLPGGRFSYAVFGLLLSVKHSWRAFGFFDLVVADDDPFAFVEADS